MPTTKQEGAVPDFSRMDQPVSSDPANAKKTGNWHGWPTKDMTPVTLCDDEGRTVRIRTHICPRAGTRQILPAGRARSGRDGWKTSHLRASPR